MAITASDVNKLRKQTGAGMMDCKKALVETDGDFEAAVDVLRKKGQKVAAKRGDNETSEGLVFATTTADEKTGVILNLSCETDFVAKNSDFRSFVENILNLAIENVPNTTDELLQLSYDEKLTVAEKVTEQIGVVGEKLVLSGYDKLNAERVVAYNHPGNQLATLVALNSASDDAADAGRQIAMQVAAMNPVALNKESVDEATKAKELEVGKDLAIQEGKPADLAEKIAHGRLNKFFKENTLLSQEFVRDNKINVEQFLKNTENGLTVTDFKRLSLT